jgi:uncharacterized membrane protein (DUF373 family)
MVSTTNAAYATSPLIDDVSVVALSERPFFRHLRNNLHACLDRARRELHQGPVSVAEDLVHFCVVGVLMIVAGVVLYHTLCGLLSPKEPVTQAAISAVNGGLFAIIIIEVIRTVMIHVASDGLKLEPFLRVGIISAVREILSVGAHLSLQSSGHDGGAAMVHLALLELGVNGAVVVGLAASSLLIGRCASISGQSEAKVA